ncbi:MAG: membrane protein insertion efficiency factor YidD [Akkermansiaceae bacterium]|nr:membrane protein insertion efficiency factor YidD [Akkermansiaceae bacterium]
MHPLISRLLTSVIRLLIRFYQRIISPMLKIAAGPAAGCRYTPSCSHYFLQAVEAHGPFLGSWYGICRIFRCHPWGGCGYDPVPSSRISETPAKTCSCHHETLHH